MTITPKPLDSFSITFEGELSITLKENFDYQAALELFNEETLGEFDYADNFSDLEPQDQLEVLRVWAWHNMDLKVAHQDYSGDNPMICVGNRPPGLKKHYLELFEIDLDNQPEYGALEAG